MTHTGAFWTAVCLGFATANAVDIREADTLRLRGRYEEAVEQYQALRDESPIAAAIGIARCHAAVGKTDEAVATLQAAAGDHLESADLQAELSGLALERGDWKAANDAARESLARDPKNPQARWVLAELHRVQGELVQARVDYRWFADNYRENAKLTADELLWYGKALAWHARFEHDGNWFRRIVNEVLPRAIEQNDAYWPAYIESARLFLEKYNSPDAAKDLNAGLAINPRAAEAYAMRARLALQAFDLDNALRGVKQSLDINPRLLEARLLEADVLLAELKPTEALAKLDESFEINPTDEELLGRQAAVYLVLDGPTADDPTSRLAKLTADVSERNRHCGRYFQAAGESCELMRHFPQAADFYEQALVSMPELIDIRGQLGLTLMRMGDETRAAKLLDESFTLDPFNVRVKNMLEVLDVLQGYAVLETEHFVLKFDRGLDDVLAQEMAEYLEREVYSLTVENLGFTPPEKTLIEIFNRAKNTDGHGWFSARMVGLPFIGTVGACAGKMIAIASPTGMREHFNWARVTKHEFVHVVNLQQTDFNIPHWYTEGLAVWHEDLPRPADWNELLARRAKSDSLFDLESINLGFIRPRDSDDWTLAYCQAELYVDFMRQTFGDDAPSRLLDAFAERLETPRAIERAFDTPVDQFERDYRTYVQKLSASLSASSTAVNRTAEQLQTAIAENAHDSVALAELAYLYWQQGNAPEARELALRAREADEKSPLAAYVLARVYLSIGDAATALPLLEAALDQDSPNPHVIALLAAIRVMAEEWDDARALYELGEKSFPSDDRWTKGLARVYLETNDRERLPVALAKLAELDYDNATLRKKLAQLAIDAQDYEAAARWANQVIQIDVQDADAHALLAEALSKRGDTAGAITRYERALRLHPDHSDWRTALEELREASPP